MQFKYLWCTSQQTFHVPCLLFAMSHGTTTENIYLHWLSLTSIENRSHISSPSWDYLKNHGICDVSSTVISFSRSQLILWAEFRLRFLKNSAAIWSIMGLPEESWHVRYFEYSYLFYVIFGFGIVAFYVLVYCMKVPTRRFTNLKDILENDPILNSYR